MPNLRSNEEWIYWGEHDPLYGVLTRPGRERHGANPWTPEEFLETGRQYFTEVAAHWRRYGMGNRHCVEIGCGAGRLTRQLADSFARVTAVDVSPAQLEQARTLLAADASRVNFQLVSAPELPLGDGACDGVFSCEVFQHFDTISAIRSYVGEAHRVLAPGGTVCIQIPVTGLQPRMSLAFPARNATIRLLRHLGRRRTMIYREYPALDLLAIFTEAGFDDVELQLFRAAGEDGFHAYFFGRR